MTLFAITVRPYYINRNLEITQERRMRVNVVVLPSFVVGVFLFYHFVFLHVGEIHRSEINY